MGNLVFFHPHAQEAWVLSETYLMNQQRAYFLKSLQMIQPCSSYFIFCRMRTKSLWISLKVNECANGSNTSLRLDCDELMNKGHWDDEYHVSHYNKLWFPLRCVKVRKN